MSNPQKPNPPTPPPMRIIREGGSAARCEICGSSLKRAWFGLGRVIGCLQPKCWNWHGYRHLPVGQIRSSELYGAPQRPKAPPPAPRPLTFIPDGGGELRRVDMTVCYTSALVADERGEKLIGSEIRRLLLEGKTLLVMRVESESI